MAKLINNAISCIESGKYKKAFGILVAPELDFYPAAQSLKGLCCVKLGDRAKARESVHKVIALRCTDQNLLNQAVSTIHFLGDYSLGVELMEVAHKADKHNVWIAEYLYFFYYCTENFDRMRDFSNDMVKLYNVRAYNLWNCVNVLRNTNPEDPTRYSRVILLSEMIIRKTMKEVDLNSRQGRNYQFLLIQVLLRESKYEEAEKEMEERLENYIVSKKLLDDRIIQRGILHELKRENEIMSYLEHDIVCGDKADWDAIEYYIQTVFNLNPVHDAIQRVKQFQADFCNSKITRESWLVRLEVCSREIEHDESSYESLTELMIGYCKVFSGKPCCYSDLERWLKMIINDEKSKKMIDMYAGDVLLEEVNEGVKEVILMVIQKKVSMIEICLFLCIPISECIMFSLFDYYLNHIDEYSVSVTSKEVIALDGVPLMMAKWLCGKEEGRKWEAIALLREQVMKRPYECCLPSYALSSYEDLEITEVHMMSLSYPLERMIQEYGLMRETKSQYEKMMRFIHIGIKEACENEFDCIRERTYISMDTMRSLTHRLQDSREIPSILTSYFLISLTYSLKDPEALNQSCFNDLYIPLPDTIVINSDYAFSRYVPQIDTQMKLLHQHGGLIPLLRYQHAVSAFLWNAYQQEWNMMKVKEELENKVRAEFLNLCEIDGIPVIMRIGYGLFNTMLLALRASTEELPTLIDKGKEQIECISQMAGSILSSTGVVNGGVLTQLGQVSRQVLIWGMLLLMKNKSKKLTVAKEEKSVVIVGLLFNVIDLISNVLVIPDKNNYMSQLNEIEVKIHSVERVCDDLYTNHCALICSVLDVCEQVNQALKNKNYKKNLLF